MHPESLYKSRGLRSLKSLSEVSGGFQIRKGASEIRGFRALPRGAALPEALGSGLGSYKMRFAKITIKPATPFNSIDR